MNVAAHSILLISLFCFANGQQRVAPGVPPQQYQDPMQHVPQHMPQHNQQQMHMQQAQMQQPQFQQVQHQQQMPQQVPMQNVQQPHTQQPHVQQQQHVQQQHVQHHPPQPQAHGHGHGHQQHGQLLNTANIAHEKQHIQEHMEVPIDTSKMTDQELQFHYFKMHDADNNNKLDGCELIKSLIHWHDSEYEGDNLPPQADSELEEMIDPILKTMDKNEDGYVEYHEFKTSQE